MNTRFVIYSLASVLAASLWANEKNSTTLYGEFRYSINIINEDGMGSDIDGVQARDNISLFGMKGSARQGGVEIFYHLQTQAFAEKSTTGRAFQQRFYFGGIRGKLGTLTVGRMTNAYKSPGFKMDPFYNMSHISPSGVFSAGGGTYGLSAATNGFTDNAVQYLTPQLNGFSVIGGIYLDDSNENDHGYALGSSYQAKKVIFGVIAAMNGSKVTTLPGFDRDGKGIRGYVTYHTIQSQIGLSYENIDTGGLNVSHIYVTGTRTVQPIHTELSLSVGMVNKGSAEGYGLTAAGFYHIMKQAKAFGLVSLADLENGSKPYVVSAGLIYGFNLF